MTNVRLNGNATVHVAATVGTGADERVIGRACNAWVASTPGSRLRVEVTTDAVTCKSCRRIVEAAEPAPPAEVEPPREVGVVVGTVACFDCHETHDAEYSHEGRFGEGAIYAVVCGEYVEHYTAEAVDFGKRAKPAPVVTPTSAAAVSRALRAGGVTPVERRREGTHVHRSALGHVFVNVDIDAPTARERMRADVRFLLAASGYVVERESDAGFYVSGRRA